MILRLCACCCCLVISFFSFSQNEANIWHFGNHSGLNFTTGEPVYIANVPHYSRNANASISDNNGGFLFSFSGEQVWNRTGQIMQNGDGIIGHLSSSQGALIVKKPGSETLYYLFTVGSGYSGQLIGLHYSVVDLNLNEGDGAVTTEKNVPVNAGWDAIENVVAVRHENGEDIWILTRKYREDSYAAFLLTANEFDVEPVLSTAPDMTERHQRGAMKVSPDKRYIAIAHQGENETYLKQAFEICKFDAATGEINFLYLFSKNKGIGQKQYEPFAAEFTPDSKLLYLTYFNEHFSSDTMELYQYDVEYIEDAELFYQSEIIIARGPTCGLQLARDGKIYTTTPKYAVYDYISVIHEPWKRGVSCNYEANTIYLEGTECGNFLMNILLDHLFRFEWDGECAQNPIAFQPNFIPEPSSILWSFGDGNISTALWPVHYYENAGEYEVFVRVTYPSGRIEETSRIITIIESPNPDLGLDTLSCKGAEIVLNAGNEGGFYAWSTGDFGENIFSITVNDTGTYWVRVTNELGCSVSDTIYVGLYPQAEFEEDNLIITPTACGGSSGSITGLLVEGEEPLTYEWYDGDGNLVGTTVDISNLSVGNYFLHVFDANGCETISEAYTITDAGDIEIAEVDHRPVYCNQQNGSIEITANTGAGTDLLYSIDNGTTWQSDNVFANLPAGNYFVKVGDQGDCETVFENNPIVIEDIPGPEVTAVSTTPENDYLADGSILLEAVVGNGDIYYSIDDGTSFQANDGLFNNLSAGTYPCRVTDDFGCDSSFTVVINRILSQVIDAIAGDGYTCIGDATASQLLLNNFTEVDSFHVQLLYNPNVIQCDGYIQIHPELEKGLSASIIPASGEVHITWKGESPTTLPENAKMLELVFSGLEEGVSQVDWKAELGEGQFFNSNGEEIAVNYELGAIRIYTRPEIIMGTEKEACEGDTIIISPFVTGGSGEAHYYWEGPNNYTSTNDWLWFNGVQSQQGGNYQLTVTDTVDCVESKTININVNPSPAIAFATYDTIWAEPGYLLEAGNGAEYYQWNTGEITEAIQVDSMGHYVVEVISYEGCKATDAVHVLWSESGEPFYMPNAFTPNGDGLNDIFRAVPKYDYISEYQLTIYNRWGQQIFECNDIDCGWDGTYKGKVGLSGVYIYKIVYEEISQPNKTKMFEGTVMLVR